MEWFNPPPFCSVEGDVITVRTAPQSDFWRETHYGFTRDSGHFYYQTVTGNFIAEVKVVGEYNALYDQAGLMVRLDEKVWIKTGIEYVDGVQQASAVVTRDFSDWSVMPLPHNPPAIWLRITRKGPAIEVHYAFDGEKYDLLRMAYLTPVDTVSVGPMCATPDGQGFTARFEGFTVRNI